MEKKPAKKDKKRGFGKYIKWFWGLFFGGIALAGLFFLLASWGLFGTMPTFEVLENPQTNLATEIISADGKTLGKFYLNDNRTPVSYDELPDHLVKAVVAVEDERYFKHSGIDARGTLRAIVFLGKKGGASTLTQQLAKQLFTEKVSNNIVARVIQKMKEWIIAVRLERQYTKEEIITMYLNIYDFDNMADGIRSASRIYFGKEPGDLKIEESAMFAGMLQNSSYYSPVRRPELTQRRRNVVLRQMEKNDFITEQEKDSLQNLPIKLNFNRESHREGLATYFRMYLQGFLKDWTSDPENRKPNGDKYNIFLDGLKVYTTIDYRMQKYAEEAVSEHMKKLQAEFFHQNTPDRNKTAPFLGLTQEEVDATMESSMKRSERWRKMRDDLDKSENEIRESFKKKTEMTVFSWDGEKDTIMTPMDSIRYYKFFLRTGMMSMEPQTGHVRAWVGGINYKHFQYDQVKQGARQSGSTFKPFVYATAIDQLRMSPCDRLPDVQHCVEANKYGNAKPWCPKNAGGKYTGRMLTLKEALAKSVNSITATLIDKVGPVPVSQLVKNLGVESDISPVPSIALGTPDFTVYEMVGAYGTFANQGVYVKPVMVTRIEDKNGTVLFESVPETRDVMSDEVAYTTVKLMEGVTQSGSGARLRGNWAVNNTFYKEIVTGYPYEFTNPIAGKTGTTQNQSDGWFMGMVPNLVTGVWVGGEDRAIHFRGIKYGQGASMALPIWAVYMKKCYADKELGISKEDFREPEDLSIELDCSKVPISGEPEEGDFEEIDF
ncbi:penicillin-binding protein 1A [Sinomicrobium weinanense]|uniref:Transglycosylase domain-containing protein n=1 Tax=Sinomicrobium weinanense TaxID=2842200 RepID=A0A926JNI7_9FLAO|nr:transglycosylase domain-containing protein [Sinomicrobium weinanense]MBC9794567.1 transglycosylase domain-containing protein [Sinomicrobium weinanense]MBU3124052.1 transglycosylase domain-containing protein [Sinomicrobium weinanense]